MMKKLSICLMVFILLLTGSPQAQTLPRRLSRIGLINEQKNIAGFRVKLIPAARGSYGFDIFQNEKLLVHQAINPLLFNPHGIQNTEDAYTVAEWIIKDHQQTGMWRIFIPPHIARQLNIKLR